MTTDRGSWWRSPSASGGQALTNSGIGWLQLAVAWASAPASCGSWAWPRRGPGRGGTAPRRQACRPLPTQPHVPVLPALHVAGVVAHDLDHGLDRVGRGDGAQQRAGHAQAGNGEHLGQALAEAAGGVRVELLQLTGRVPRGPGSPRRRLDSPKRGAVCTAPTRAPAPAGGRGPPAPGGSDNAGPACSQSRATDPAATGVAFVPVGPSTRFTDKHCRSPWRVDYAYWLSRSGSAKRGLGIEVARSSRVSTSAGTSAGIVKKP